MRATAPGPGCVVAGWPLRPPQSFTKPSIKASQSGRCGLPAAIHRRRMTLTLSSLTLGGGVGGLGLRVWLPASLVARSSAAASAPRGAGMLRLPPRQVGAAVFSKLKPPLCLRPPLFGARLLTTWRCSPLMHGRRRGTPIPWRRCDRGSTRCRPQSARCSARAPPGQACGRALVRNGNGGPGALGTRGRAGGASGSAAGGAAQPASAGGVAAA